MRLLGPFAFWSLVAWIVLRWQAHPRAARAWTARLLLVAAIVAAGAAPFLTGSYSEEVVLYIAGPNPYRAETIERSYRALALGVAAILAALAAAAGWGDRLPIGSPLGKALALTAAILVLRVALEKLGIPREAAMFVGIIWLIVPLGVYFGVEAARIGSGGRFWKWLVGYTYGVRIPILLIMLAATHLRLGTHFDNSWVSRFTVFGSVVEVVPRTWDHYRLLIIFPQLLLWPAVTILAGIVFGLPAYALVKRRARTAAAAGAAS